MKMTKKNISEYCLRNGVLVYEQYDEKDRRKRFYRMSIPVFTEGETIPTSNYDYIVHRPIDCYNHVKKLLEDDEFKGFYKKSPGKWGNCKAGNCSVESSRTEGI